MEKVAFANAYYIKLGRGGEFADWSMENHRLWFGWDKQSPEEIDEAVESSKKGDDSKWKVILDELKKEHPAKGVATNFFHQLKNIAESTSNDVWITFHKSHLWWCRLVESGVFAAQEGEGPKYRETTGWSNEDVDGNRLVINHISGRLSQTQGFRGTTCRVSAKVAKGEVGCAADDLKRLLNNQPSEEYSEVQDARAALIAKVKDGMKRLFWKDFEILADLIFSGSGWRRISVIGGAMKDVDMEYEAPVTDYLYQVQVKSIATLVDFQKATKDFPAESFRKLYFVVHSPEGPLANAASPDPEDIELILPGRLAEMVVNLGLVDWLLGKIK